MILQYTETCPAARKCLSQLSSSTTACAPPFSACRLYNRTPLIVPSSGRANSAPAPAFPLLNVLSPPSPSPTAHPKQSSTAPVITNAKPHPQHPLAVLLRSCPSSSAPPPLPHSSASQRLVKMEAAASPLLLTRRLWSGTCSRNARPPHLTLLFSLRVGAFLEVEPTAWAVIRSVFRAYSGLG
jgi:hypothetical protein